MSLLLAQEIILNITYFPVYRKFITPQISLMPKSGKTILSPPEVPKRDNMNGLNATTITEWQLTADPFRETKEKSANFPFKRLGC